MNFQRGAIPLIILSLLKSEDMYGYQLVLETRARSGGQISVLEGSLYPVLYKMQEMGHVSAESKLVGKRMTRVYYHLEPSGVEYLAKLRKEYETTVEGIFTIIRSTDETAKEKAPKKSAKK